MDVAHDSRPFVEKYRPSTLEEMIGNEEISGTLNRLIDSNQLPHLLFYGPPGTGKTTTVLACARRMYGANFRSMVLELNASDDRGIDVVREQIKSFASTKTIFNSGSKLIILDECDAMTKDAQFALRRVIEKFVMNARFCLICNFVNRIIPALQSRCTKFRFGPLPAELMSGKLDEVVANEEISVTPGARQALLVLAGGDMRKTLNVLQSASMAHDEVDEAAVYATTGDPEPAVIDSIFHSLLNDEFAECNGKIKGMRVARGFALVDIVSAVHLKLLELDAPDAALQQLFEKLADVEYRLSFGTSELLQTSAVVGAFSTMRDAVVAK